MMIYNIIIMIKNLQGHELIILEHWSTLFPKDQHNWLMRKYSCLQLSEGWSSIKVSGGVSDWHKTNIHHSYHKHSYNFFHPLFCQLLPCSYIANKKNIWTEKKNIESKICISSLYSHSSVSTWQLSISFITSNHIFLFFRSQAKCKNGNWLNYHFEIWVIPSIMQVFWEKVKQNVKMAIE